MVLLVDEDESNDDNVLIVCDEKWEKREVDSTTSNVTIFVN